MYLHIVFQVLPGAQQQQWAPMQKGKKQQLFQAAGWMRPREPQNITMKLNNVLIRL